MSVKEKIEKQESKIKEDFEILQNLRDYRLSEELGMSTIEVNAEISKLEKDVMKRQKTLGKLQAAIA